MTGLDIPFPESEFQFLDKFRTFNLIYPYEHPLAQIIRIDMMVRLVAFDDNDYTAFINKELQPQNMHPSDGKLLEIGYLRECVLGDVASFEWANNYGPDSPRAFCKMLKLEPDTFVKVVSLKNPNYSLKSLNNRYASTTG